MKRPAGFTVLSLISGWLALGGFAMAWAAPRVPPDQLRLAGLSPSIMTAGGLAYCISAFSTSVGLWRSSTWAPRAILAWGACTLLFLLSFQAMIGVAADPWWLIVPGNLFFIG